MARQQKTPAQRAQEQLDIADRLTGRLAKKIMRLEGELAVLRYQLDAAKNRRDYLKDHPDLKPSRPEQDPT